MRILACALALSCATPLVAQSPNPSFSVQDPGKFFTRKQMMERAASQAKAPLPSETEVPASAPVVTLNGVCDTPRTTKTKECKSVLTRGDLDSLADLLIPDASPLIRRQFAVRYARLLAGAAVAQQRHLDKDPAVLNAMQAHLKFERVQVLTGALYSQLELQAAHLPDQDIQKYYKEHATEFEQVNILRLALPKSAPTDSGQALDSGALRAKAEELRAQAAAGGDIEQLQQQGYKDLGIKNSVPSTKVPPARRNNLSREEQGAFDMKAGEVSPVLESKDELVIIKLVSKQPIPLAEVREEIVSALRPQRMHEGLQAASNGITADFNLKYLDMAVAPELFLPPLPNRPGTRQALNADARAKAMAARRSLPSPATRAPMVVTQQHQ